MLQDFSNNNQYSFKADRKGSFVIRVILQDDIGKMSMQECAYEVDSGTQKPENVQDGENDGYNTVTGPDSNAYSIIMEDTPEKYNTGDSDSIEYLNQNGTHNSRPLRSQTRLM